MSTLALSAAVSDDDAHRGTAEQALKVVLLGDSGAGKTAMCCRFARHIFPPKYAPTAGVDFYSRRVTLPRNTTVLLQLWDVGGHNLASPSMLNTYIYGAQVVLFIYDVTSSASFENLADWVQIVKKAGAQMEKPFCMAMVGTKTDNEHRRVVRADRHNRFAEQNALSTHYVSAKTGDNIELMFNRTARHSADEGGPTGDWNTSTVAAQISAVDRNEARRGTKLNSEDADKTNGKAETEDQAKEGNKAAKKSSVCSIQ